MAALQAELAELRRQRVNERSSTVSPLLAAATHELRNPLSATLGNLEIAIEELGAGGPISATSREAMREALADALLGAQAVRAVVADLSVLITRDPGPCSVSEAIDTAARLAGHPIRNVGTLELTVEPELVAAVSSGALVWILLDLLRDATAASRTWPNRIHLEAEREGQGVRIVVRDDGDGRAGVLLPLAREAVESAAGWLSVDAAPGRGTAVTVWLPLATDTATARPAPER